MLRLLARRGSHSSSDPDDGYRNVGMQGESDAPEDMVWEENVELVEAMEMGRGLEARRVGCDICGTANRGWLSTLEADEEEEEEEIWASKVIPDMSVESL